MSKVIRLTESDIRMIVKRIIKESGYEDRDYDYIYQELGNYGLHPNYMYFDEFEQSNFYDPRMTDDEYVASMYDFITQENDEENYQ